jgi:hypothetical protein
MSAAAQTTSSAVGGVVKGGAKGALAGLGITASTGGVLGALAGLGYAGVFAAAAATGGAAIPALIWAPIVFGIGGAIASTVLAGPLAAGIGALFGGAVGGVNGADNKSHQIALERAAARDANMQLSAAEMQTAMMMQAAQARQPQHHSPAMSASLAEKAPSNTISRESAQHQGMMADRQLQIA